MRLFAHRGFTAELHPQNSVASLKEAVAQGFKGIEFDLWYVDGKLLLKHDRPQENEVEVLPQFKDYLTYQNDLFYWLDFKNLDEENCAKALAIVKNEIEKLNLRLDHFYFVPYITDLKKAEKIYAIIRNIFGFKANVVAVCDTLKNEQEAQELRRVLDAYNIKKLSIFHQLLSKNSLQILLGIEIFAWTVNDISRLRDLETLGITNFATDKITPQIYEKSLTLRTS